MAFLNKIIEIFFIIKSKPFYSYPLDFVWSQNEVKPQNELLLLPKLFRNPQR